jgi:hypothetical protein
VLPASLPTGVDQPAALLSQGPPQMVAAKAEPCATHAPIMPCAAPR